jgi:hypothetical protein
VTTGSNGPLYEDHILPRKGQHRTPLRGVDKSSHLLTTDDQNRVLASRCVGDGGVVENERPAYASQRAFKNGKRTNMLLLLL